MENSLSLIQLNDYALFWSVPFIGYWNVPEKERNIQYGVIENQIVNDYVTFVCIGPDKIRMRACVCVRLRDKVFHFHGNYKTQMPIVSHLVVAPLNSFSFNSFWQWMMHLLSANDADDDDDDERCVNI